MVEMLGNPKYWENIASAWKKVTPPVRPSLEDIKIYRKFLKKAVRKGKQPKILVLGATPEMRDLAAEFKAETTVCDISLEMIMAMSRLMKNKKATPKEIWLKNSWTTAPLPDNYFDAVLGDGVTNNISWQEASQWWQNIKRILKPGKVFVTRTFDIPAADKKEINKISHKFFVKIFEQKNIHSINFSELNILLEVPTYNKKTGLVSNDYKDIFFKEAEFLEVPGAKAQKIYQNLIKVFPEKPVKFWRAPTKEQTEKEAKTHFKIIGKTQASSFFVCTVYCLRK